MCDNKTKSINKAYPQDKIQNDGNTSFIITPKEINKLICSE